MLLHLLLQLVVGLGRRCDAVVAACLSVVAVWACCYLLGEVDGGRFG
jgi:hypothetical protein